MRFEVRDLDEGWTVLDTVTGRSLPGATRRKTTALLVAACCEASAYGLAQRLLGKEPT